MGRKRVGLNIHVYPSPFEYESRILKVTKTLVARGVVERIIVIATAKQGLPGEQVIDDARRVRRIGTTLKGERLWSRALRFIEWSARVFTALCREPVSMVNCHSLSVLPLCVALKWWHRSILVYEPHELETETARWTGLLKQVAKAIERGLIRWVDCVITVSTSIAERYRQDHGLDDVHVILNVPETEDAAGPASNPALRTLLGIPMHHLVFMYQGVLDEARGVSWLLEAFRLVSPDRHLVFLGFGPLEEKVRAAAATTANIHLHPAVPPSEIMLYTRGADVGFALLTDDCLNHRFALPNKFFHYIHAGLPVIASDLEEMGSIVDRYGCGWRVANDPNALAACVTAVESASVAARRNGALRAMKELHWAREADRLESIYSGLLSPALRMQNKEVV